MPAERHHEGHAVAQAGPAGGHDRQAAREADADHADAAIGRQLRLIRDPRRRVLDDVGVGGRDPELAQVGRGDGHDRVAGGGQVFGHADQARLVDAVHVHAGHQQHRARDPGRAVEAGGHGAVARGYRRQIPARGGVGAGRGYPSRHAFGEIGGADDEGGGIDIGPGRPGRCGDEQNDDEHGALNAEIDHEGRMLHCAVVKRLVIAVDGPSGAGKGTVARASARALGYRHVDTGAMYRAVAWLSLANGTPLEDSEGVAAIARAAVFDLDEGHIRIDGHDVSAAIRTPDIDRAAALVARNGAVRELLVERQRAMGRDGGVVMEGRDIGTVVFPGAELKIYLDASPDERARRRATDPAHTGGKQGSVAHVAEDLAARDRSDATRTVAPLVRAADAVYIDTTGMSIDDVVARVLALAGERQGAGNQEPPAAR